MFIALVIYTSMVIRNYFNNLKYLNVYYRRDRDLSDYLLKSMLIKLIPSVIEIYFIICVYQLYKQIKKEKIANPVMSPPLQIIQNQPPPSYQASVYPVPTAPNFSSNYNYNNTTPTAPIVVPIYMPSTGQVSGIKR
jgi:hypothetical protein